MAYIQHFLSELRRRNVYQVAVTYVVVGFFVIEAADVIVPRLGLPAWTVTLVITLAGLGFPIALVMAWALEMTPEGVRAEEPDVDEDGSVSETTAALGTLEAAGIVEQVGAECPQWRVVDGKEVAEV